MIAKEYSRVKRAIMKILEDSIATPVGLKSAGKMSIFPLVEKALPAAVLQILLDSILFVVKTSWPT